MSMYACPTTRCSGSDILLILAATHCQGPGPRAEIVLMLVGAIGLGPCRLLRPRTIKPGRSLAVRSSD